MWFIYKWILNKNQINPALSKIEIFRTKEGEFEVFNHEKILDNFSFSFENELKFESIENLKWVLDKSEKILQNENIKRNAKLSHRPSRSQPQA